MTTPRAFPSLPFFTAVADRIEKEREAFRRLGFADTTFGVRVTGGATFVLALDTYSCTSVREVPAGAQAPEGVDFVLEAPIEVWERMLSSLDRSTGHVQAEHTINTLTHHDRPMSVAWSDPAGHDKLFRFQESIQLLFDLAARQRCDC